MLSDTFAPTAGSIRLRGREIPGEAVASVRRLWRIAGEAVPVIGPNGAGKTS